jgi:acetylornithine deacetylase/succinyl-diaminopimelate desuccinylase-like protein
VISDTAKLDPETPAITYGTKGLVYKEVKVFGPAKDLHSGSFGGSVANPATILTGLVAALKDEHDRILLPGFYDDVKAITDTERDAMGGSGFDEAAFIEQLGAPCAFGEAGYTVLERRWTRPTLDVNGLYGGYMGEGAATVIPASAGVKLSMRLVLDQDPERISRAFDDFLRARCPDTVRMEIETHGSAGAYVAPLDSEAMRAASRALASGFGREPARVREGGTLPILPLFKRELGAESVMMGFCRSDCNLHSPNEFFHLSDFHAGTRSAAHFLGNMSNHSR